MTKNVEIDIIPFTFTDQDYDQGRCALKNAQGTIGAITVSLSQEMEKQAVNKILITVLVVSIVAIGIAFGLSLIFSRKTVRSIHNIVDVLGTVAEGDLRERRLPRLIDSRQRIDPCVRHGHTPQPHLAAEADRCFLTGHGIENSGLARARESHESDFHVRSA